MPSLSLRSRWLHAAFLLAIAASLPLGAKAQAAPGLPEADKQAIQHYTLNEDVFNRLVATTKEAQAAGIHPQQSGDPSQIHSLDDLANQAVGSDKRIAPLIAKHGFTPREFLLANIALMNAGLVVQSKSQPELAKMIDQSKVNSANVAFYESHRAQIEALMQSARAQQAQ
ncbi:hypothetical protein [Fulvimonas soli]|jgi:hypothetical protein|uniref:Uncharacterized protein n=1 Tax=Fulvimonas soli TaxID=155197 RepID=A0A316HYK2_9GAMM|nr:hypothetical protein [Fulvimonas soli]PWK85242.1 hypothetical protein C7456_10916 [Fulvimonas soli]TNY25332.1 hypothetical protein BV497_14475 [Fulvimonas soli]